MYKSKNQPLRDGDLKAEDRKDNVFTRHLEIVFERKDSKETVSFIEEKFVTPATNNGPDIISSRFYKVDHFNGTKTIITDQEAMRQMVPLVEKYLMNGGDVTYHETQYDAAGKVVYSY